MIPFVDARGQANEYIPDYLVYRGTEVRPQLVEVKPDDELREKARTWSSKWKAARRFAQDSGWDFRIHTDLHICCISLYFAQLSRILPRDELVPVPRYSGRGQLRCRDARRQIMTHGRSALAKQSFCAAADATQSHQGRLM